MTAVKFPFLYYQAQPGLFIGFLVGSRWQWSAYHLRELREQISDQLQQWHQASGNLPLPEMKEVQLMQTALAVRPVVKESQELFTMWEEIEVPVTYITAKDEFDNRICFIPLLDMYFTYQAAGQLKTLVPYFAERHLAMLDPEELYRMIAMPAPSLDFVGIRVSRRLRWQKERITPDIRLLQQLATPYPESRSTRQRQSLSPDIAWEMENKIMDVSDKLIGMQANLLVIGEKGVGKTAVLKTAIKGVGHAPAASGTGRSFWRLKPQRIIANATYLGDWQLLCEQLIRELQSVQGVLWVDDIVRLAALGGSGTEDSIAAYLIPFLHQQSLQMVGELTPGEWESLRRLLPAFVSCFQTVRIDEMPEEKVYTILDQFNTYVRQVFKTSISRNAIHLSCRLLKRYYPYERFPGKAIRFLGKCLSDQTVKETGKLNASAVLRQFILETGFPEILIRDETPLEEQALSDYFDHRIIGQPQANEMMKDLVRIFKAGIQHPGKPIATVLFAGPTGVGKTEAAKALAGYFFGAGQRSHPLIRLDMSEFQSPEHIEKFIGHGREPGQLVRLIRERPFTVLLLDEVEKADPAIFDALLTVFDEGMLTDAFGRITHFRNTIIIMTTNLGAGTPQAAGFGNREDDLHTYHRAIRRFFRPELLNRLDHILVFHPLSRSSVRIITLKELQMIHQREGVGMRNLKLIFTDRLTDHIAEKGFDAKYGARPIQRAVEIFVIHPLAYWLLDHPEAVDTTLTLDYEDALLIHQNDIPR